MSRPLTHDFEDDLGRLVDDYLLRGVTPADVVRLLKYEATHDHAQRRTELLRQEGIASVHRG